MAAESGNTDKYSDFQLGFVCQFSKCPIPAPVNYAVCAITVKMDASRSPNSSAIEQ